MAISFDETDDYYSLTVAGGNPALPDGDWCVGIWTYVADNAGAAFQYLISNNIVEHPSFNLYLEESSNKWHTQVLDTVHPHVNIVASASTGADNTWRLVIVQRDTSASQFQLWFCEYGNAAVKTGSQADPNFGGVNGTGWNIGRRKDGDANRYYGSIAAEFFKGDFALTDEEITAMGHGKSIATMGHNLDVYFPMYTAESTLRDVFGTSDATRNSSPSSVEHAPVLPGTGPSWALASTVVTITPEPAIGLGAVPYATTVQTGLVPSAIVVQNYVRFLVGDIHGQLIGELNVDLGPVSWRLNDVGRAKFSIARTDSKATDFYLRFGNRVLIQFDNGLPDWGGVLDPPRTWTRDGHIACTAYSAEHILGWRITGIDDVYDGTAAGAIFRSLIENTNENHPTGIVVGNVWSGGAGHILGLHFDNVLDTIQEQLTQKMEQADFYIEPGLSGGRITFTAHYFKRRGLFNQNVALIEAHNIANADLKEAGPIINVWQVLGQGSTWDEDVRPAEQDRDDTSIATYDRREEMEARGDTADSTMLLAHASNLVSQYKDPIVITSFDVIDKAPADFSAYDVGDSVHVWLHNYGFSGYDHMVRVLTREYDPGTGLCKLVVEQDD